MIDNGKRSILGVDVDVIDYEGAVAKIILAAHKKEPCTVSALAVHGVMTGALDATHKYRLNRFSIVTPDGQPVRWALRILHGCSLRDRVYGPELTLRICEAAATYGIGIFLFGASARTTGIGTGHCSHVVGRRRQRRQRRQRRRWKREWE